MGKDQICGYMKHPHEEEWPSEVGDCKGDWQKDGKWGGCAHFVSGIRGQGEDFIL